MTSTRPKKNIRLGRPSKYNFGSIRAGGKKFIATDNPKAVRNAAQDYARRHGIILKTAATDDGLGVDVRRPVPKKIK